ncbi:MAG TPA: LysM peptidoglycan-binding domain-containing protein, partial [Paludibacteraceae bacterium]|nr:LysM peptidoglycan-binding domain-containing protein [Paludibacteraceae bacterium]
MRIKISTLLLVLLIICSAIIYAQKSEIPTKIIDGKEYYIYQVEAGEGLYSISKKFGVSQADINNANPQIYDGIKAGQEILIPKTGKVKLSTTRIKDEDEGFVLHTVEKKQTLFAISRKYNVTQEDIREANPQLTEGLKTGDVLR